MIQFNKVYNIDCIKGMKNIPDDLVDLIISDPPFGIDLTSKRGGNYRRIKSNVIRGYVEVPSEKYYEFSFSWMKQAYRVLNESGSMYVFSGWNNLKDVLSAIDDVGFKVINHIIWKYQFGVYTLHKFITSHIHVLYVCKNMKRKKFYAYSRFKKNEKANGKNLNYKDREDVWMINRKYWSGEKKTPTKLPLEIMKKMISYSSAEGDLVLDPFAGSGQSLVACKQMNRNFIGFEICKDYCDFIAQRLSSENEEE